MPKGFVRVGQATCDITLIGDSWYVGSLYVPSEHTGKGHGLRLMRVLYRWARRHRQRIHFFVGPFGHRTLDTEKLVKMYEKAGFRVFKHKDPPFARRRPWMEYSP